MKHRYARRLLVAAIAAGALGALPALPLAPPIMACSTSPCQSTQQTVVFASGALTVSAPSGSISFGANGQMTPGSQATANIGELDYDNTLGDTVGWSVSVASTDMVKNNQPLGNGASCAASAGCIAWTGLSFAPGTTFAAGNTNSTCTGGATTGMTAGTGGAFAAGTDTNPGSTYSPAQAVMTGATAADQGCYKQTGSTATLTLPTGLPNGTYYYGTFQYTITG